MTCDMTSTWLDYSDEIIGIGQLFISVIIGSAVVYIADQQRKINRNKLRFDLYDRRFTLYNEIKSLLGSIVRMGDASDDDLMGLMRNTKEAIFLFKEDIPEYIAEIHKKANELHRLEKEIANKVSVADREEASKKREKVFEWFSKQFEECTEKFKKYLSFENVC